MYANVNQQREINMTSHHTLCYHAPWGYWHITMTDNAITALQNTSNCKCTHSTTTALAQECTIQLNHYCNNTLDQFTLPLHINGTAFQEKVWQTLQHIPKGQTMSYKDIATHIQHPGAARAVGNACNKNPLPIFIPCHRVTRSGRQIGGFALGTETKKQLLIHENVKDVLLGYNT